MNFTRTILPNGLRVVTIPLKDNPTVTVLVMVEAGSKYEDKKQSGLSHFVEHMCFKGTPKRPTAMDISRELDSIGSQYNAFTAQEFTGYYAKAQAKHFSTILDVVSDIYLNPVFDAKEIEKEKGVIVEEIKMYEDMPHRHVQDVFMELLYGDQPAGWNIAGTQDIVKSMAREDFISYRQSHYVASATTVVVAGHFNETEVLKEIEKSFAGIPASPKKEKIKTTESQNEPKVRVKYKKTDQAHMVLGVRSYDTYDTRRPTVRLIEAILGGGMSSRLFQKLREEMGVGYYVRADEDSYTDHGYFEVSTGVDISRVPEVMKAILAELKRLTVESVTEVELKKVKDYTIGGMLLALESSDSIAEFLGYQEILRKPIRNPDAIAEIINAVTAEDIQKVAKELFVEKNLNFAIIGPFEDEKIFLDTLHF